MDLNCDMGESFGRYTIGMDDDVMPFITSANIACGCHAGDPVVMNHTVSRAAAAGVGIGAHPGYPDRQGFGRRFMALTPDEIKNYLIYQIGALKAFCAAYQTRLGHVKPHGALHTAAVKDGAVAKAIAEAIVAVDKDLLYFALSGKAGEMTARIGRRAGLRVVYEAFPDRNYTDEGTLTPRDQPHAVITDPDTVARRALQIAAEGRIKSENGNWIKLDSQTLCVHGDTAKAVSLVQNIRTMLDKHGINVTPVSDKNSQEEISKPS